LLNIAVFASGRGSNFEALHRALLTQNISARIVVVISNNSQSGALTLARSFSLPGFHISRRQFESDESFTKKLLDTLRIYNVQLIVLAGYMKKLDAVIIKQFCNRIINIHPALLPKYGGEGMYGMHVHEAVIKAKEKFTGATVHVVDEEYDHGRILKQEKIAVDEHDTPETLAAKVLKIEHKILPDIVRLYAEGKLP
jgi:phosphoribosylglycinamide formyltransferase-1